jgi:hypothetical protein
MAQRLLEAKSHHRKPEAARSKNEIVKSEFDAVIDENVASVVFDWDLKASSSTTK